jgi:arsenite/tail-anchored protein-transporting ATPase
VTARSGGPRAPWRLHVFAGKGGVGKTTCAAAAAVAAAERGRRVAVISTDPAHSLGDALGRPLGPTPRRIPTRAGRLDAIELDADRALRRWLARRRPMLHTIAERGTYLDDDDLERLLRLSFPGVDELMALVELTRLAERGGWELVVVDTAPTGHALRMLAMPETLRRLAGVLDAMYAKHRFLGDSFGSGHRRGAADALIQELDSDGRRLAELLRDPARCRLTWLMLPEALSLEEARDGVAALSGAGIAVDELIVNRLSPPSGPACGTCRERRRLEHRVAIEARGAFPTRPVLTLSALDDEPRGVPTLRALGRWLAAGRVTSPDRAPARRGAAARSTVPAPGRPIGRGRVSNPWIDLVAPAGIRLVVFAGKGGVGKTTCAAATALSLARRQPGRVLLLSADPAHSLADVLATPLDDTERRVPGAADGLRARELDADRALARARERYREAVEETFDSLLRGSRFDVAYDREALHALMDLAPPGLDELFAVLSIVEALAERRPPYDVVVLDTAPTGHALRLLEMPATALAWVHALLAILLKYREVVGLGEVAAELVATARRLRELSALLADPARARVVVVTRAAVLPVDETRRLLRRLVRMKLTAPAVIVNALSGGACARCARARRGEGRAVAALGRVARGRTGRWRMISTPGLTPPPRGVAELDRWVRTWELAG